MKEIFMKKFFLVLFLLFLGHSSVMAAVQTVEIEYDQSGTTLKGYLAYDDTNDLKRPAVLVVHEWWGHNDYARKRARMLAQLGFVAFAVDMYGDGKQAQHPDQAGAFMKAVNENAALSQARFQAAYDVLKNFKLTDSSRIGAIGYCFGGATVLKMAMAGVPLKGVVSFHGSFPLPEVLPKAGDIKAKILICHGAEDQFATAEQIDAFKNILDQANANYTFEIYQGAKHSFTNPDADSYAEKFGMPLAYNKDADQKSWNDMELFLKEIFEK